MTRFIAPCLAFAGVCLLAGSAVGVADWAACLRHAGGEACRASRADAMAALSAAANVALGVALQETNP
jgi:hypothetical protein